MHASDLRSSLSKYGLPAIFAAAIGCLASAPGARAADPQGASTSQLLTGTAAYGDWKTSAPGIRRLIKPGDLPEPYQTTSSRNPPLLDPRPEGAMPQVPPGFTVSAYVGGLDTPRQMRTAPNGDIFLSESGKQQIRVLRAAAGADKAEAPSVFAPRLKQRPYGLAFYPAGPDPQFLYVATEGEVLRYPYKNGDITASGAAQVIVPHLPVGHHWTRDLALTPDGKKLLVAVGSGDNDGEEGMAKEENRADILEFDPDGSGRRVFAAGIRNPVTIAFHPQTGDLWASVNERDGLGDNLPPDYVTRVTPGGFYGWPWYYIGNHLDPRHQGDHPDVASEVLTPDVLLQPHSAPLGLAVYTGDKFPAEYRNDIFVASHGSWNRASRTGYKLIRIRLDNGKPTGEYDDFMTGFTTEDGNVWGRPVGVDVTADGAILVSDDGTGTIWRIAYSGAGTH